MFGDTMYGRKLIVGFVVAILLVSMTHVSASSESNTVSTGKLLIMISDAQLERYDWNYIYTLTSNAKGYLITLDNQSYAEDVNKFIDFAKSHDKKVFVTYTEIYQNGTLVYKTYTVNPKDVEGVLIVTYDPEHLSQIVDKMKSVGYKKIYVMYAFVYLSTPVYDNTTNTTTYKDYYREQIPLDTILNNNDIDGVLLMAISYDQNKVNDVITKIKSANKEVMVTSSVYVDPYTQQPIYDASGEVLKSVLKNENYNWVVYSSFDSLVPSVLNITANINNIKAESSTYKTIAYVSLAGLFIVILFYLFRKDNCENDEESEIKEKKTKEEKE